MAIVTFFGVLSEIFSGAFLMAYSSHLSYSKAQREFIKIKAYFNNNTDGPGATFCYFNRIFLQSITFGTPLTTLTR